MLKSSKNTSNNQLIEKLVLDNCLTFGRHPKLTNQKIAKYICGTRHAIDIFKLYELRYLLLKIYPLIHNLFLQNRLNMEIKTTYTMETPIPYKTYKSREEIGHPKIEFNNTPRRKRKLLMISTPRPMLPKILFATTTPSYASIVHSAAKICHMPFHQNRWLCGSITAASSYVTDIKKWYFLTDKANKHIEFNFGQKFYRNKTNAEQTKNKLLKYQKSRKPSLVIIPDISNNSMIIEETNISGIPVIGLVNSDCKSEIAYPIFANDQSSHSVHFFCHFLANLIAKEVVKKKHKLYTVPRVQKKKKTIAEAQAFEAKYQTFKKKFEVIQQKFEPKRSGWSQLQIYFSKKYIIKQRTQEAAIMLYRWKHKWKLLSLRKALVRFRGLNKEKIKHFLGEKPYLFLAYNYFLRHANTFYALSPNQKVQNENQNRFKIKTQFFTLRWKDRKRAFTLLNQHAFNFAKVLDVLRLPKFEPKFFWFSNASHFATSLSLVTNTNFRYEIKRYFRIWRRQRWDMRRRFLKNRKSVLYKTRWTSKKKKDRFN
jgi:ribosomal protein S2